MSRILVCDGGGNGWRIAEVINGAIARLFTYGKYDKVSSITELFDLIVRHLTPDLQGIAFAVAGIIEEHSKIVKSPNLDFLNGVDLGKLTTERSKLPCIVANDMEAAGKGMWHLVPQVHGDNVLVLTASSGIGGRILDARGNMIFKHTELGHICIDTSIGTIRCKCGLHGCAEAICGGDAVAEQIRHDLQTLVPNHMHPCAFLDQSFDGGWNDWPGANKWAIEMYDKIAYNYAQLLATIQQLAHVRNVIWKGTFAEGMIPRVGDHIIQKLKSKVMIPEWGNVEFYLSPHVDKVKNADSFIGGAMIFKELKHFA